MDATFFITLNGRVQQPTVRFAIRTLRRLKSDMALPMMCLMSQQDFFSNTHNKVQLNALHSLHLEAADLNVYHSSADADHLIVCTATQIADSDPISVIPE